MFISKLFKKQGLLLIVSIVAILLLLDKPTIGQVFAESPVQNFKFSDVDSNQIKHSLESNSSLDIPYVSEVSQSNSNNQNSLPLRNSDLFLSEINTELDPTVTRPNRERDYCWVPGFIGPIQPSPITPPTPFLYQPFGMDWDGSGRIWSSSMDHMYPNYQVSGGVASMGESLSGVNLRDRITVNNHNYDYYVSLALEEEFGYDGHDGHDFRTFGVPGISALASAGGLVVYTRKDCKVTYNALGCYVEIYHDQGYLTRYAHLDSVSVNTGELVWSGKPIGIIGTTGASTGIHLHFAVFHWNPYRTIGSNEGEWEVTDPFGWDPWLPPEEQDGDPLFNCNGEVSYNLWVGGWPQRVSEGPSQGSSGPDVFAVGGWLDDDFPFYCSPPTNGIPRDNPSFNNRSINFTWSPPSCSTLDQYEIRVSKSSDVVNSAFLTQTIAKGQTSFTHNFDSGIVPDGQRLYWAMRSHNDAGWSAFSETWSFTIDTRNTYTPPAIGNGEWTTTFFSDLNLSSGCGSQQNFTQTYVFKNWGESAPVSGCPDNNWSSRMERDVYFQGGNYTFALEADDWARIYVDNQLKVDHWNGASGHYEGYVIPAGTHRLRIEFADTAGNARISAWWKGSGFELPKETEDFSQWFADYWPYPDPYWDSVISVREGYGKLEHQWGNGDPSYGMPADGFSAKFRRDYFFACGTYQFSFNHDDGINFKIDGVQQFDRWNGPIGAFTFTKVMTQGVHRLEINYHETGGSAHINFDYQQLGGCNPSAPTLQSPSNSLSLAPNAKITLSWLSTPNASQYYVKLMGGPGVDVTLGWINSTSYYIGGLWPGDYSWSVTARNDYGSSSPSASWSFTIEGAPSTPPDFRVTGSTQTSITLAWSDISNETGYKIYEWNGINFYLTHSLGANTTSFTDTGLGCGAKYAYELSAYNTAGESTHAGWIEGATSDCPVVPSIPSIPSDFRVTGSTQSSITMAWSDTSNETGYHIYEWNGTEPYLTHTLGANTTHYTDTGLACGTEYAYALSAYNTAGEAGHAGWIEGATSDCPVVPGNSNVYLPIIMVPSIYQTVPFGLGNPYF